MARLIPRKQIEDQQNISSSFSVGGNLNVGQSAIISGSLFVSESFFFGSNTGSLNEITGSVFLTGSLTIDGTLRTTAPNTILSITASNASQSLNTQLYNGIRSFDFGANVPTLYVSSTDGDDTNDGRSIQYPLRTIKRAAQLAQPGYDGRYGLSTSSLYSGYVIRVQAGTYVEDNPVIMPKNSTIWGSGLRITKILAKNKDQDLFWVNSGCYVAEVTVGGMRLWPDQINPERGFGFAFQPGAFITTSPYIQNCSQISNQENSFAELYEDIPPGGGGLYVNGDVVDPDSPLCSMVLDAYTQISPNGVGCLVNGRGFIQLVSMFNNFSYYAIRVNNGGHATLNNSNISFGLYGMYASGSRLISGSGGNIDARDRVRQSYSVLIDVLNKGLEEGLPPVTVLNTEEGIKVTNEPQIFLSAEKTVNSDVQSELDADFTLVSAIVESGTSNYPTLLAKSSNKGYGANSPYNILGATQYTASISASNTDLNQISASFGALLGIFANGTGSYDFKSNTNSAIKATSYEAIPSALVANDYVTGSVSSSFENIISVLKNGINSNTKLISNNQGNIGVTGLQQFFTGVSSSLNTIQQISASFSTIYNIIANGTGSPILDIPVNHKTEFAVTKTTGDTAYVFDGIEQNPTLTLFRGNLYKFYVSASTGADLQQFWIRKEPISGIDREYDYNDGIVNNGDSNGTIYFNVPYDAPNTLYYVAENSPSMIGILNIVNSTSTPLDLVEKTLTYPATIYSSSNSTNNVDYINAYDEITNNLNLIKEETVAYISSSWSGVVYDETKCKRDIGYIVNAVTKDLLYGGNEESIRAGLFYYLYPSQAIESELQPTLDAVKYVSRLSQILAENIALVEPDIHNSAAAQCIVDNRQFVQNETIVFLSSSWSGGDGFYYNEAKCKRDIGYILDAVATDLKYGGNERSIVAGEFYYKYPSAAIVAGVPSSTNQLQQTLTGIRYAAGTALNLVNNITYVTASQSTQIAFNLLRANKTLIQDETIQYINVAYPQLKYNTAKCRRDVGYIIDAIATDLLYGGNERAVTAGNYYYNYPSVAITTQKKETSGAIRYAKIISNYIVQNIILDTPRIVYNDEKGIKVTSLNNVTSSYGGTITEQALISSSFNIVEGIIKNGLTGIPSVIAKNTDTNWGISNPLNVSTTTQSLSNFVTPNEVNKINQNYDVVTGIIKGGLNAIPALTSSKSGLVKVSNVSQIKGTAATQNEVHSVSGSIYTISNIVTNGLSATPTLVANTSASIYVTSTSQNIGTPATSNEIQNVSSSISTIVNVVTNGTGSLPGLIDNTYYNIAVTNTQQYVSSSGAAPEDIEFISQSISYVTRIIEEGYDAAPAKSVYTTPTTATNTIAAYQILKNNIEFIQNETIAYLSSSWSGFDYNEAKCKRDVGLIISGAAEDLFWNTNSASIVNGQFYLDYPSQATSSQLIQTLDGINYASRLAQKVIQNVLFVAPSSNVVNAANAITNNKKFIQDETIAFMSSSWGSFDYNEAKCRRDIGYILDAAKTDLVYGGNERTSTAAEFYFLYPSQANQSQLIQTTDAVNWASIMAQKLIAGVVFQPADINQLNASNLLSANKKLIAEEVVAYVSSSWSGVYYNEAKCKRDVGYIIDAARTDLVYGGNQRAITAGTFYYLYPSSATVAGVPSSTNQLDMTITGINYANGVAENIILNRTLISPSQSILNAREFVKNNRSYIQQATIDFIAKKYPYLTYDVARCYRDTGFITDAILTDLVYGGNERSITAGYYYFKYPSKATTSAQVTETVGALEYAKELTGLVALGQKSVDEGFSIVTKIIESGSVGYPTLVENTKAGIRATNETQYTSSLTVLNLDKTIVSSSFGNVINIIANGTGSIPTIVSASFRGINKVGNQQITSSTTPSFKDTNKVTTDFDIIIDVIGNGVNDLPNLIPNASGAIKVTNTQEYISTSSIEFDTINKATGSFDLVAKIIELGTGSLPQLIDNTKSFVKVTNATQYSSSFTISRPTINQVSKSFDEIINIVKTGVGSLPNVVTNTTYNIKVGNVGQITGSYGTSTQATQISQSIGIVTNIIANGASAAPAIQLSGSNPIVLADWVNAHDILVTNIPFIQSETIAYLSASWNGFIYNQDKCSRDLGYILNGAAKDLLYQGNEESVRNGLYYYLYPSQATGTEKNQTLDGIRYASTLAQKIIVGTMFQSPSNEAIETYNLLHNNKQLIQSESVAYISSSWSNFVYNQTSCSRDIGYIVDAVATDALYGGNERTLTAGQYYYLYPSQATGVELDPTIDGVRYAKNLSSEILRGAILQHPSQNNLDARDILIKNKLFIQNETVAFISSSWADFQYTQSKCIRDIGYIIDAVATDIVYGGNERSIEAGEFYYKYPSQATGAELNPTLTGVRYAKGLAQNVLNNIQFNSPSNSSFTAYQLLRKNKSLIQNETIAFLNSAWSFYNYNQAKCRRDVGYMIDAISTDILYGGNERAREAGYFYYKYPSNATVDGNGQSIGQLGQTLDGMRYAKGLAEKIVSNVILQSPTTSQQTAYNLLLTNKSLIQKETIAFLSSSWSGVDGFSYNEASCSRDVAYIIDNVATDLLYGGNERSSKAGEYYYLYPSKAIVKGSGTANAQIGQTIDGVRYVAGLSQTILSNKQLIQPTDYVKSAVNLLKANKTFIQDETIQFIGAFFPYLVYAKAKCRRDVGYILDGVITDLFYGGNERSLVSGDYYYRYPNLATTAAQSSETVTAIDYAKALAKKVVENKLLVQPKIKTLADSTIKATNTPQYISQISGSQNEINYITSSFGLVMDIIAGGLTHIPNVNKNADALIKVTDTNQYIGQLSGSAIEADLVTSSFKLIGDIIDLGENGTPEALAKNYDYGFQSNTPTLLHITSTPQLDVNAYTYTTDYTPLVSASYATIIDIVNNGTGSIPSIIENTSSSIYFSSTPFQSPLAGTTNDINKIGSGFGIVIDIVKGNYPTTLVSNTNTGIKVTNTPQLISGSGAERLQSKLVSSSFAVVSNIILNGTGSQEFVSSSTIPNTNPKITSAYNLLLGNEQMIIDETIAYMSSSWSTFDYNEAKCRRDLGYIIGGAAHDLLYGGNSGSYLNGEFYALIPSQATSSQLDQTLTAIRFASGLAEKVVRNTLLTHISASQSTSASYVSLLTNKAFIQEEVIHYIDLSWSSPNFTYDSNKCRRDVGYIVDAVATDLLYGGNERSFIAGDYYYRYPSQATTSQLQPTLDGVNYAKGLAMNVANNTTFTQNGTDADLLASAEFLYDNKSFIQDETIAFVNAKYPNLYYDQTKCRRDVGYIVDAVLVDLLYGGNQRAVTAGEFYYKYPSLATDVQLVETTAAIDYARRLSVEVINGNLIPTPQTISNVFNNIKVTNTQQITGSYGTQTEANSISASIGIVTNIVLNGTGSLPTFIPYVTASNNTNVLNAYNLLKQNIPFIQNETIAYLSSSWSNFPYNQDKCKRDVGYIVSGAAEDLLWGSNSASIVNGEYYYLYPSQATGSQLDQTLDGIRYASGLAQQIIKGSIFVTASLKVSASYDSLRNNKQFIQDETIAFVSSSWNGFAYSEDKCRRDVGYLIDAVSTDLLYGGNERGTLAGQYYYKYPSQATGAELAPTLTAIDFASGVAANLIQNKLYNKPTTIVSASVDLLRNNRGFIQNETMAFLTASWSTFNYNQDKCKRDVGYIVDAVTTDLLYNGNQRATEAGRYYFLYPSEATTVQVNQTNDGVRFASGVAAKLVKNIVFQTASLEVSASFDLLRKNRKFIQAETIAYVSSSWSQVVYNEASCSRDIGYILDAAATDLLYGGQERSVTAGSYYFLFPSRATNPGVPSEQNQLDPTITGVRYGGRLAKRVIVNPTFTSPTTDSVNAAKLIVKNKKFIQKETIAFLSSSWSTLQYNEISCSRDLGFIIDAVATDIVYGGNERAIQAGSYYYYIPSVAIIDSVSAKLGQKRQTLDGINYARGIAEKITQQTVLTFPPAKRKDSYNLLRAAKGELKYKAVAYTNGAFPYLVYNEASCSRDTGFIVDAISTDMLYGGNQRGVATAYSYFTGQYGNAQAVVSSQRLETLETNRYLRTRAEFIVANAPLEVFGSLIVATGIDYSYNGAGVTFKALPPNQGGSGKANPLYEVTELGGGRIYYTSGNQDGNFKIGNNLVINQATGTLQGRTFSKSLFSLVTPFSLALESA